MDLHLKKPLALFLSAVLLLGAASAAAPRTAQPNSAPVTVDGRTVAFDAYAIAADGSANANTYFKLRDVAMALNGTAKQFNVTWDGAEKTIAITSGAAYLPVGGELEPGAGGAAAAVPNASAVLLDGRRVEVTAYTIRQNNYFMLRDLGRLLDFGVDWVGATGTVAIRTDRGYGASGGELSVCLGSEPQTIDPTLNVTTDGASLINHFFEGLMKWEDGSAGAHAELAGREVPGAAILVPGQASGYEKTANADGGVTYTFHLRDGIYWSDGRRVTAGDFVYAWNRLVDPETAADYSYIIDMVKGYQAARTGGGGLSIAAPDDRTFVVDLTYDCPYFLEACAHTATMPLRSDVVEADETGWTLRPVTYLTNGPYRLVEWTHNVSIQAERNPWYYGQGGPQTIHFLLTDNSYEVFNSFRRGELDFALNLPIDAIPELMATGEMGVEPYLGTYFAVFNTTKAPFDDPRVRKAFSLVLDRDFITQTGEIPADALVPPGVRDAGGYGEEFRAAGGTYWSTSDGDRQANCEEARRLLAEAGYPGGQGFPAVRYLYNTSDIHQLIAMAMAANWRQELGVEVELTGMAWNAFLNARQTGEYDIARHGWIADYNDPYSFLEMWATGSGNNDAGYSDPTYDGLLNAARTEADSVRRMALLHQAEDILMADQVVMPVYFYTNAYVRSQRLRGLYYSPLGYWFFGSCTLE